MGSKFLTGDQPWPVISGALGRPNRRRAYLAIGFVGRTAGPMLKLNAEDVLVCDASEQAVSAGATDPPVLKHLLGQGVKIHSCAGLHAKCTVVGKTAWIGSANASRTSSDRLAEAVIQVTESSVVAEVRDWILEVASTSPELTSDELDRLTRLRPERDAKAFVPYDELEIPETASRLFLAEFEGGASKKAYATAQRSSGVVRDAARAAARRLSALDWFEWHGLPHFRPGDWLIDVTAGQRLSRPRCVHAVTPFGNDQSVVWYLRSMGGTIPTRRELISTAVGDAEFDDWYEVVKRNRIRPTLALYR